MKTRQSWKASTEWKWSRHTGLGPSTYQSDPCVGDSGIGLDVPGAEARPPPPPPSLSTSSALFLRPNDTPQLLARLASRLLALAPIPTPVPVASGLDGDAVTVAMGAGSPTVEWRALGRWYDVVRRRCTCVCESRLATPIVGEPSGEGMFELLRAPGMPPVPMPIATVSLEPEPDPEPVAEDGVVDSLDIACSEMAVVGMAFVVAADGTPPKGIRAAEKRDEDEPREARDPGRRGEGREGTWMLTGWDPDAVEGPGMGRVVGDGGD